MIIFVTTFLLVMCFSVLAWFLPGTTLILTLPVMLVLFFISLSSDYYLGCVLAPVILIIVLTVAAIHNPDGDFERWPRRYARRFLITVAFIASFYGTLVIAMFNLYALLLYVLIVGSLFGCVITHKRVVTANVLSTIGASIRQNLPLPMALLFAAGDMKTAFARAARRIAHWLSQGYSLSESIRRGFPSCPGHALAMITAAEKMNQLPRAFECIEKDLLKRLEYDKRIQPVHPLYPIVVFTVLCLLIMGLTSFVMPKYSEVLRDMAGTSAKLPIATQYIMDASQIFRSGVFWLIFLAVLLIAGSVVIRVRSRSRNPQKPFLLSRIGDFVKWHLPILNWFERNYSLLRLVEVMRLSLDSGSTIDKAIRAGLDIDTNYCFRSRVRKWSKLVEQGENVALAVRKSNLSPALVWAFECAGNDTPNVLESIETCFRSNYSYRVNMARFILWPCLTLFMGLVVGFVAYAIFLPQIKIITFLTTWYTP